jgi:hypothetical protein
MMVVEEEDELVIHHVVMLANATDHVLYKEKLIKC